MFAKLFFVGCALALAKAAYNGPLAGGQPAAQYPAGIDPASCPNYPDCSSPFVAISGTPQARQLQYNVQPQYNTAPQQYNAAPQQYNAVPQQYNQYAQQPAVYQPQPQVPSQRQYAPEIQNALDRGEYIGDGDYHGEGLAEAGAPGYQQAAPVQARAYNPGPAQYAGAHHNHASRGATLLPAGVDASQCPNYPFCS